MEENVSMTNEVEETGADTEKTYTQDEVLKLIQAEADKRVNQALKTQQKKYEKQISLSKLDGDEREKAEKDNRIAELEAQLAQYNIERNKSEIKNVLSSRGLSAEFADILAIGEDTEANQALISRFNKMWDIAVKTEVEKRLAGKTPKGNGGTIQEITKESAKKMSLTELNELASSNPELFNKLFG